MSRLSDTTLTVYTPVLKDNNGVILYEGGDYYNEQDAIDEAHTQVSAEVRNHGFVRHIYAVIEKRVVPIYQ